MRRADARARKNQRYAAERQRDRIAGEQHAQTRDDHQNRKDFGSGISAPCRAAHAARADRLRDALQGHQQREERDQRLEQEHERQAARFARAFEDRPGARDIGHREPDQHEHERQQQQQRAEKVDQCLRARRRVGIEHIDAHMAARLQRPGRRQHEQRGVGVDDRSRSARSSRGQTHSAAPPRRIAAARRTEPATPRRGRSPHSGGRCGRRGAIKCAAVMLYMAQSGPFAHSGGHVRPRSRSTTITTMAIRSCPRRSCACARSKPMLTEKGYVDPAALDLLIETYENKVGPRNGARVDRQSLDRSRLPQALLEGRHAGDRRRSATSAAGRAHLVALENTPKTHNMVVCTLCSCYPWPVLGLPPVWYKSAPYRSRAVKDPRGVLNDFGVDAAEGNRNPRLGFNRRDALSRAADAARRHRRLERGEARRSRHARLA